MLQSDIDKLLEQACAEIGASSDLESLDRCRVAWLGKSGTVTAQLKALGGLPPEQRRAAGQRINELKATLQALLQTRRDSLQQAQLEKELLQERIDVSLPGRRQFLGGIHPVTRMRNRMVDVFARLGFEVATGPEIEDDEHNFEALNFPAQHPARAMHDTFYFPDGRLLRTHTSPVQIRAMRGQGAPLRVIAPGRVYRSDSDQTHSPMFNQLEGLLVDEGISFADLKGVLQQFVDTLFERHLEIRLRPSYFPFTEPSAEVDIAWQRRDGSSGWLEVLGCGMVHPNVLEHCNIDSERYTGYAFGMGIERFAMLRYGVTDLRQFFDNDLGFLEQFV
ncbi:MAG: phenylalanine--tRNA ligase subunit alpha [Wenzhouxiangellaceae bacterium]